jgi:hypothetical protein
LQPLSTRESSPTTAEAQRFRILAIEKDGLVEILDRMAEISVLRMKVSVLIENGGIFGIESELPHRAP